MADAVGLWVIMYFCVTAVNTKDKTPRSTVLIRLTFGTLNVRRINEKFEN